jgi:2'-hydroxyisoflavone reductase
MKILVIGGTLFIGRQLVERLRKAGHEVWVLHRKPEHTLGPDVGSLTADRNDPDAVRAALAGHRFDAVYDNVYDWERGTTAEQVEACARAAGDVSRYVFMSSVAAYGAGLDHKEEDELALPDHPESYVRNKAESERTLFRLHRDSGLPVVTLRPPYVYGPGNPFYRETFFWERLRAGRPIILPDSGVRLMQFVLVGDLVETCLRVLSEPRAVGEAFNVAHPAPLTQAQVVEALGRACGMEPRTVSIPRERILAAGGHPLGPNLYFAVYYDMPPITVHIGKARRLLGFVPSDFDESLHRTYEWYRTAWAGPAPDYSFEDRLLREAGAAI